MRVDFDQSFPVQTGLKKTAWDNGWRIEVVGGDGWLLRRSHDAPGCIGLAAAGPQGPWYLAIDHAGVAGEMGMPADIEGPGVACFVYPTSTSLDQAVSRAYDLSKALPDDPLQRFQAETASLPSDTEAERLVIQRIGQDRFRDALMRFWEGRCPLTGITDPELLRASHMKPWAACDSDAERLDVYNGLLLSALWDAAFDRHLVTFREDGTPEFSPRLSTQAREKLERDVAGPVQFSERHIPYLEVHRRTFAGAER